MKIKYFKKIYKERIACGCWKECDAINYNAGKDYTVEWINEKEYNEIKADVYKFFNAQDTHIELLEAKKEKHILTTINENTVKVDEKITKLEAELAKG